VKTILSIASRSTIPLLAIYLVNSTVLIVPLAKRCCIRSFRQRSAKAAQQHFVILHPYPTPGAHAAASQDLALAHQSQHLHVGKTACQWSHRWL